MVGERGVADVSGVSEPARGCVAGAVAVTAGARGDSGGICIAQAERQAEAANTIVARRKPIFIVLV
jgi:hypothetical protein